MHANISTGKKKALETNVTKENEETSSECSDASHAKQEQTKHIDTNKSKQQQQMASF